MKGLYREVNKFIKIGLSAAADLILFFLNSNSVVLILPGGLVELLYHSSQCTTTGVIKAMVCTTVFVG